MRLVIDVGNTTIVMAIFENNNIVKRFFYDDSKNINEVAIEKDFCDISKEFNITQIVYSSVVPNVDRPFSYLTKKYFAKDYVDIRDINIDLDLKVNNKSEIGADLLADLYAAKVEKKYPCLIIDLGTANKFLLLDDKATFYTCLISPGIMSSFDSLFKSAALLNKVEIGHIPEILEPRETKQALVGGLIYTSISTIEGVAKRYEEALGYKINKIVTGGNAKHLKPLLKQDFEYDDSLILRGLNYAGRMLEE